jgi:hypothetical protein
MATNQIPQIHQIIALTNYRAIITTNYDRLIEAAFTLKRPAFGIAFTQDSVASLANALYNPDPFILKLHGDVAASDSLVLTAEDYDRFTFQSPYIRLFMNVLFLNYTVPFVGYSLRDPDFRLILKELNLIFEAHLPEQYAFVPDATEVEIDELMETMKIQVIPYCSENNHQELAQHLEQLQRIAPYENMNV